MYLSGYKTMEIKTKGIEIPSTHKSAQENIKDKINNKFFNLCPLVWIFL